jgi:site-specific DNA recombinase
VRLLQRSYGRNRFGCAAARDRATCTNHLTIHIEEIEAAILTGLKEQLMEPTLFEAFAREFMAEVNRGRSALASERETLRSLRKSPNRSTPWLRPSSKVPTRSL